MWKSKLEWRVSTRCSIHRDAELAGLQGELSSKVWPPPYRASERTNHSQNAVIVQNAVISSPQSFGTFLETSAGVSNGLLHSQAVCLLAR